MANKTLNAASARLASVFHSRSRIALTIVTALATSSLLVAPADAHPGPTTLVTRASDGPGGPGAQPTSFDTHEVHDVSADGRYVVFISSATNLDPLDTDSFTDIFVRDTVANTTEVVSMNSGNTASANLTSSSPSISADGRFVAFQSNSTDMVAGDTTNNDDIFVRDLIQNTTTKVSNWPGQGGINTRPTLDSAADGVLSVTFLSHNPPYFDPVPNSNEVFVKDFTIQAGGITESQTTLVSHLPGSSDPQTGGDVLRPQISSNGNAVAYCATTETIVTGDANNQWDVVLWNRSTNTNSLVTVDSSEVQQNAGGTCIPPGINSDGRYVSFLSSDADLVANDTNNSQDMFVRDTLNGTTTRVSTNSTGAQAVNGASADQATLSDDGRYIAFSSGSPDLVANDSGFTVDVFVKDLQTGTVTRESVDETGDRGSNLPPFGSPPQHSRPILNGSGNSVVFFSNAYDIATTTDSNDQGDLFIHALAATPPPPPDRTLSVTLAGTGAGEVSSSPAGIDCGLTCEAVFDDGQDVTLTAEASPGSVFTGWSGGCSGTSDCELDMTQDRSVTATFGPAPDVTAPAITNASDGPDPFTPNGDGVKDKNTLRFNVSEAATVRVGVYNANGKRVRKLLDDVDLLAGNVKKAWNGRNDAGRVVAKGVYEYRMKATDAADNASPTIKRSVTVKR